MTYAEFIAKVRGLLTVDANRKGAEELVTSLITLGILDLQHYIEAYRIGHKDTYEPGDFSTDWFASRGDLPAECYIRQCFVIRAQSKTITSVSTNNNTLTVTDHKLTNPATETEVIVGIITNSGGAVPAGITESQAYFLRPSGTDAITLHLTALDAINGDAAVDITSTGTGTNTLTYRRTRHECLDVGWDSLQSLITGHLSVNDRLARIAIEPMGSVFYVFPAIKALDENGFSYQFELNWDGKKSEWEDNDTVKFTFDDAQVVADFVASRVERRVKRDLPMSNSYAGSHALGRKHSYLDALDRGRSRH